MAEVDNYLRTISQCKGVEGIIILSADGFPIRSSLDEELTVLYSQTFSQLARKAHAMVQNLDPQDDVRLIRYRTKKHEILLAVDDQFIMITVQVPQIE
ncbi:Roadblock-related_dynein light chain [Hexamita inflata]|nr:Roadblock-related dynein light chain [Hexamita inflata]CAI9968992.1 Roadblock-related dynein light chain [Hexamita inflata]